MCLLLGGVSLVLGIIGIFIPVLPTTPFLLLSALCFLRSSAHMYNWIIGHKVFGRYIYSYLRYRAIPMKTKLGTLAFLWSTLAISMILVKIFALRILLVIVGIAVTIHILTIRTLSQKEQEEIVRLYNTKNERNQQSV